MNDQTIKCPGCGLLIPLSETLTKQLHDDIESKLKLDLEKEKQLFFQKEKAKMWEIAQQKAKEKIAVEIQEKDEVLEEQKKRLSDLEKQEIDLRRAKREVEEKHKQMALAVERKIDEIQKQTSDKIRKELEDNSKLKLAEKEKQIDQMRKTIEDLKRKSDQGSMQIQGDALESDLKNLLSQNFPGDLIKDVPTGITGADLVQEINARNGVNTGIILWELKNTKAFSQIWVEKMRDDLAKAKADVAILVTRTLPEDIKIFGEVKGILVVEIAYVLPLVHVVRSNLIAMYKLRKSLDGGNKKMDYLYQYLLSPEFKAKIENIINAFSNLKEELDREKRAMTAIWARREKEIERVISSTAGLYGDLQGATDSALPKIDRLELTATSKSGIDKETDELSQDEMPF
ncbi:hypothetical protein A3J15_02550 [Candidatus Roizmanbacteria bacterium RIFCSPLOWO2_02_FULL_38_10]|uniref:DUF2130 domain-containing protein n=1 Tax=Candidatus Roizmanbacteria bacterium RIFCSPLOWO2_02_FULL_38_10 TaxID=1802074 RepID=A0A1F7JM67_9BACT|nr:MAG: hypothetical protein A3J15_02550 [Candidatus Roizmanbacteria bacterium RIFCSPLOWO2_02_FULL_38_10]